MRHFSLRTHLFHNRARQLIYYHDCSAESLLSVWAPSLHGSWTQSIRNPVNTSSCQSLEKQGMESLFPPQSASWTAKCSTFWSDSFSGVAASLVTLSFWLKFWYDESNFKYSRFLDRKPNLLVQISPCGFFSTTGVLSCLRMRWTAPDQCLSTGFFFFFSFSFP